MVPFDDVVPMKCSSVIVATIIPMFAHIPWLYAQTPVVVPPQARFVASTDTRAIFYYPVECDAWRVLNPTELAWYRSESEIPTNLRPSPDCIAMNQDDEQASSPRGNTLPVQPPPGAQFVALDQANATTYYPIGCTEWHKLQGPFRWFAAELEARIMGLQPSEACGVSVRYETIPIMTTIQPPPNASSSPLSHTSIPQSIPRNEPKPVVKSAPETTKPKSPAEPAKPEPTILWAPCTIAFVTENRKFLCEEGYGVVLVEPSSSRTAGTGLENLQARNEFARKYPPGLEIYVEILGHENNEIAGRVLKERPVEPGVQMLSKPNQTIRYCIPLHGTWVCRKRT